MPLSSTSTSMAKDHRYFTKSCKIFTAYATFTDELFRQYISSGNFFWHAFSVCTTVGVFFFTDRISDKKRNYQRSKCRQIVFVSDFYRWSVFFMLTKQTLQDFTVLLIKLFRRSVIHSSSVIFLSIKSLMETFRRLSFRL